MATIPNRDWLVSQYWFLVGQLTLRDSSFTAPFSDESIVSADPHELARVNADLRKMASIPPPR